MTQNRTRQDEADAGGRIAFFLLGGMIGAVAALLFAPKSGRELRSDIADTARKGVDQARERAGEYYEVGRERASEMYTTAANKAGEIYATAADKATEIANAARDAALKRGESIQAAIEAGKRAYAEEKRRTEASGMLEQAPTYYEEIKDASQS